MVNRTLAFAPNPGASCVCFGLRLLSICLRWSARRGAHRARLCAKSSSFVMIFAAGCVPPSSLCRRFGLRGVTVPFNPAPQTDAREAAHFDQPSQSRAVGRERYSSMDLTREGEYEEFRAFPDRGPADSMCSWFEFEGV